MPRNYTRKHQRELEDLYDILLYYKCDPTFGIVGRNITILSPKRRRELLDWLWKQIHHKDVDYYGETLATALHHLTPELEEERLKKKEMEDILHHYETLLYYHSKKEAKSILMEEHGLKTEEALEKALYRARVKERKEREERERKAKEWREKERQQQKEKPRTKNKFDDSDIPF
jgi:hypothetical protein